MQDSDFSYQNKVWITEELLPHPTKILWISYLILSLAKLG